MNLGQRITISQVKKRRECVLAGWVQEIRRFDGLRFLVLRDRSGRIQITAKRVEVPSKVFKKLEQIGKEWVILVRGRVRRNPEAPQGIELIPKEIEVLAEAEAPVPLDISGKIESALDKRLDWRFLDLRNPKVRAIFKVESEICDAARDFFLRNGFLEIHTPKIVAQATESGATVFPIDYFERKAFLAQSPQFYKQMMMAAGFDRVFEIAPAFRAEPHHTTRHLCEYTSIDFELAFIQSYQDVMKVVKKFFSFILTSIKSSCKEELKLLGVKVTIPRRIPKITMREAYEILRRKGKEVKEGEDLDPEGERLICEHAKEKYGSEFLFLTQFPWKVRPFYTMRKGKRWTSSFDLLWRGWEVTTGGQREHRYGVLKKQCKEKGFDPNRFEFYLNFFRYGMPPHGGAGIGLERVVARLLGLKNIREATLLPRDPLRLTP
jgi:aspartyl-tRNA synthetase